jgi:hypothetical protein
MNWKLILIGGLVFYVVMFVVSFATGPVVHNNILMSTYEATGQFWRPELMADPPNMAALLPRWITTGLIGAFICAGIYGQVRSSFAGPGWQRGAKYGFILGLLMAVAYFSMSGVFNLPDRIWGWWSAESIVLYVIGGAALGWVADKLAPRPA